MFNQKGLTLLEVIVTVAIIGVMVAGVMQMMSATVRFSGTVKTIEMFKKLRAALETTYKEQISHVETHCYGWTDPACHALTILPRRHHIDNTVLLLNTFSDTVVQSWRAAGCTVTGSVPHYSVQCTDGRGELFIITTANEHIASTFYNNAYARTPYSITFVSGANQDIRDTWSSGNLDAKFFNRTREKHLAVASAMRAYHISRLVHEAIVNMCGPAGGLESYDDVIIPWYWHIHSANPFSACAVIEVGRCGCFELAWQWQTSWDSAATNTSTEFALILPRLGLNNSHRVDGFGNPIQIWFTVDSQNVLQAPPPRPQPRYSGIWGVSPPYRGIVGVWDQNIASWRYSEHIIYPQ
jgi:prepilin-type N-terminal cleavage/methylation domain-containing protein